ncbi:MAG: response regulator [Verrucomicrobiota bacterium]|nr:response regulator [Verrucomicrobiota bacterium]
MKILLVEDHADSRRNLQRLIERRGHDVVAVGSAEEAETVLGQQSFPFLILDWMLPGKSGVDLCRELRARERGDEMFILLVTARGDTEDLHQALEAGANDYLTKPLDLGLLNVRLSVAERQIRDLSERNQARAALQDSARKMTSVLENTTDGFFAVDRNWTFTYLNAEAEALLGRTRDELYGGILWEKFPEEVGSVFQTNYERVMQDQEAVEFEAIAADGRRWFEVHAYPSEGGMSVFFRDVTERKRSEDERLTTSKLESLGTLAGGIAHDLNNILTVISGNIGLAQIEAPSDAGNLLNFLGKAGEAAQHAAHLSSQLLTFSKGGAPVKKVTSVGQLVRQAAEFSLYGSNIRAEIEIAPNLWNAEVDPAQFEQVMNALVLNARDAMPYGGTIRVTARNADLTADATTQIARGRYLEISINDRGPGVPEELTTKIFDPYFTTKPTASGLGLAISYSIVKKHGGLLLLENTSAQGSTFTFYLPASDAKSTTEERNGTLVAAAARSQRRVLVMDDEPAIRDLTSQLLATLGYQVTAVPDGVEAIKTYERALRRGENYQAVILDATVRGGLGGIATIERLRELDPQVNAIICSGYSDEAALSEFLDYGFRGALPKPFTRGDLDQALKRSFTTIDGA